MRIVLLVCTTLALAACATPEARVRTGLTNAGLSAPMAACMAERMVDRLSLIQLRRLGDLPYARDERSVAGFLHRVRALRDTEIWGVTSAAAAVCAVRG